MVVLAQRRIPSTFLLEVFAQCVNRVFADECVELASMKVSRLKEQWLKGADRMMFLSPVTSGSTKT
jgi:hypothetical protein